MSKSPAEQLFEKYKNGTLTREERLLLEEWYLCYASSVKPLQDAEMLKQAIADMDNAYPFYQKTAAVTKNIFWKRITAAAAVLIIFGIGLYLNKDNSKEDIAHAKNIGPGKNTATLTLADGRRIRLSEAMKGELTKEAGMRITKVADGRLVYTISDSLLKKDAVIGFNTITTASSEQYQVNLPDGTKVWLNAVSSIKFPVTFNHSKERKVELTGEAYFEVTKDKAHPFIVQSKTQKVQVLGTHFDINAYADEPAVKTTLLEGSVVLSAYHKGNDGKESGTKDKEVTLAAGQQGTVSPGNSIRLTTVNTESVVDWKNGDFIFKGGDLRTSMRKIARWYNVEVVYEPSVPADLVLGGWLSRSNNLYIILDRIESTGDVHFKVQGRRITVTK